MVYLKLAFLHGSWVLEIFSMGFGGLRCSFILILSRTPCRCCLRQTRKGQDDKRLARWEVTEHVREPRMP